MDLQFYGANCIVATYKGTRIVIDDNLAELGAKSLLKADDVALFTAAHEQPKADVKLFLDHAGEFEVGEVSIYGISARAHMDEEGKRTATMYKLMTTEISVLVTGHIYPELSDEQLESIGLIDVMFVPVGGSGYTLDPVGAMKVIKKVEPKLVVPVHYNDKALNFPVPQVELEQALKELAMEPKERVTKLKAKSADLTDVTQLVVLEKS